MNCSIALFRNLYYFYGIWIFNLIQRVKLTVLKIVPKTVPKISKNSSESLVLLGMSGIFMIYGEMNSFRKNSWKAYFLGILKVHLN